MPDGGKPARRRQAFRHPESHKSLPRFHFRRRQCVGRAPFGRLLLPNGWSTVFHSAPKQDGSAKNPSCRTRVKNPRAEPPWRTVADNPPWRTPPWSSPISCHQPCAAALDARRSRAWTSLSRVARFAALAAVWGCSPRPRLFEPARLPQPWPARPLPSDCPCRGNSACTCDPSRSGRARCAPGAHRIEQSSEKCTVRRQQALWRRRVDLAPVRSTIKVSAR
jgi:hypothetical protein